MENVRTGATGTPHVDLSEIKQDIIANEDAIYDLGSEDKRWAYIYAVIAVLTSAIIGGVYLGATTEGWFYINASTYVNGSLNVSGNVTSAYYFGDGSELTGIVSIYDDDWINTTVETRITDREYLNETEIDNATIVRTDNTVWITDNQILPTNLTGADVIEMVGNYSEWDKDYADLINPPTNTSWDLSKIPNTGDIDIGAYNLTVGGNITQPDLTYHCFDIDCNASIRSDGVMLIIKVN